MTMATMNSPVPPAPLHPGPSARAAICPRDHQARLDYFCTTFCAYCLPHDLEGESFTCIYGEQEPPRPPGAPVLPEWQPWYWGE
jgi:hypothetical protein